MTRQETGTAAETANAEVGRTELKTNRALQDIRENIHLIQDERIRETFKRLLMEAYMALIEERTARALLNFTNVNEAHISAAAAIRCLRQDYQDELDAIGRAAVQTDA